MESERNTQKIEASVLNPSVNDTECENRTNDHRKQCPDFQEATCQAQSTSDEEKRGALCVISESNREKGNSSIACYPSGLYRKSSMKISRNRRELLVCIEENG